MPATTAADIWRDLAAISAELDSPAAKGRTIPLKTAQRKLYRQYQKALAAGMAREVAGG